MPSMAVCLHYHEVQTTSVYTYHQDVVSSVTTGDDTIVGNHSRSDDVSTYVVSSLDLKYMYLGVDSHSIVHYCMLLCTKGTIDVCIPHVLASHVQCITCRSRM